MSEQELVVIPWKSGKCDFNVKRVAALGSVFSTGVSLTTRLDAPRLLLPFCNVIFARGPCFPLFTATPRHIYYKYQVTQANTAESQNARSTFRQNSTVPFSCLTTASFNVDEIHSNLSTYSQHEINCEFIKRIIRVVRISFLS